MLLKISCLVPDLDYRFCDELSSGDLRSEIHSPGTSNEVGVSESSILEPKCFFDQFRQSSADEMHGDSGSKCWHERPVEDKMNFTSSQTHECEIHDFLKTVDTQSSLENACTFGHDREESHCSLISVKPPCTSIDTLDDAGSVSQCTEVEDFCADNLSTDSCAETQIANTRQRRSSRPPLRYLDGSPWLKSRLYREKKHPTSSTKEKDLEVRYLKKYGRKALEIKASKALASNLELDSDEEYEPVSSGFNIRKSMKRSDRRKNSKPWTLDEVAALINGMSQFGTGQWTSVKRAFFSSSSRTATDIKISGATF